MPDYEGDVNLSGELSHKYKISENTFFIGPLSRFSTSERTSENIQKEIKMLFLLSGPEPQRTIFETLIINQLKNISIKAIIVRGITESYEEIKLNENVVMYSHLPTEKLIALIRKSEIVVSRSGYSSIMDWCVLGSNALLVPTPGQTEQEYLALYMGEKNMFYSLLQKHFDVNLIIDIINKPFGQNNLIYKESEKLFKRINQITDDILKKHNFAL